MSLPPHLSHCAVRMLCWCRCRRKSVFSGVSALEWSGVPVCRPVTLLSLSYWQHSLHAKSVVCQARDDILLIWDNWRGVETKQDQKISRCGKRCNRLD